MKYFKIQRKGQKNGRLVGNQSAGNEKATENQTKRPIIKLKES